jgi:cytochrome b561/polyisoprenoid-binding protein YceI
MAIILHWSLALLLAFQIGLGWQLEDLPKGQGFAFYQFHKSVGISILLLTLLRIGVRLYAPRPAAAADNIWASRLSKFVHFGLYAFMLGVPISGWIMVSTSKLGVPTQVFGLFPWPNIPLPHVFHEPAEAAHGLLSWFGIALFVLHVAGALRHHFLMRDGLLGRILPGSEKLRTNMGVASFAAVLAIAAVLVSTSYGRKIDLRGATPANAALSAQGQTKINPASVGISPAAPQPADAAKMALDEVAKAAALKGPDALTLADTPKAAASNAKAVPWQRAPGGSLGFVASWSGTPINGRFGNWNANVVFGKDDLKNSNIVATVNLGSATTSDADRDASLQGSDFFNTAAFPEARFTSRSISFVGGDRYRAAGVLSLRGKSVPVTLNFTLKFEGDDVIVTGSTVLNRTTFGVGQGQWASTDQIAGNVAVNFAFKARRKN